MTGIEELGQRLKERFNMSNAKVKQVLNGESMQRVLTILNEDRGLVDKVIMDNVEAQRKEAQRLMQEARDKEYRADSEKRRLDENELFIRNSKRNLDEQWHKFNVLKDEFGKAIEQAETPEARDRIRLLEVFKNSLSYEWWDDSPAYVAGCIAILSGGKVDYDKVEEMATDTWAENYGPSSDEYDDDGPIYVTYGEDGGEE